MHGALRAVAFLEFLVAAARARVITTDVLQGIAHGLLMSVAAIGAVNMAVIVVVVVMIVIVIVIVIAIRAMHVGLLVHRVFSGIKSPGIISPSRSIRTLRPNNNPV